MAKFEILSRNNYIANRYALIEDLLLYDKFCANS